MNINEILADAEEISIRVAVLEKKTKNLSAEVENLKTQSQNGGASEQTAETKKESV